MRWKPTGTLAFGNWTHCSKNTTANASPTKGLDDEARTAHSGSSQ
ncbi:hypothetical protein LMG29542_08041 [Paraburkholderia humisilvae]|uniref:Uncharacterized protein n=1 Tax=Paraburkholderia humisilvae TaxID=627669 RepID=A0A6J5F8F8_9BURK|nr:hypothetical protein LMG29542_08041 [Paraburkholderia humisilvae]